MHDNVSRYYIVQHMWTTYEYILHVPVRPVCGYMCGCKFLSVCYTLKPTFAFGGEAASFSTEPICFSFFHTHS